MESIKNRRRSRSFRCFRPVEVDDDLVNLEGKSGSGEPVCTYIGDGEKESMVIPKSLTTSLPGEKTKLSDGDLAAGGGKEGGCRSRRSFSRVLKAVFFETSLAKKVRKRKARQKSQSHDLQQKTTKKDPPEVENDRQINSSRSSSGYSSSNIATNSFSSSCVSSITSNLTMFCSNSMESKLGPTKFSTKRVSKFYGSNTGLYLILFSLLVLIFWGKVCAILCTSMWLLFAPSRKNRFDSPVNGVDFPAMLWEEHKKRIIMEGLLERNRSRVL